MQDRKTLPLIFVLLANVYGIKAQCRHTPTTASGSHAPSRICSGDLIFQDNFDHLDHGKWQHEHTLAGGGNWEFQWYTNDRSNSYTENGVLKIKPTLTKDHIGESALYSETVDLNDQKWAPYCTNSDFYGCRRTGTRQHIINPIRSARIRTKDSFAFRYGRVVVRAKMPAGDWLWPAIWMMPRDSKYGVWPASGEIDIVESRGNKNLNENGNNIGVKSMGSTLHFGPDSQNNGFMRTHWSATNGNGFHSDFFTYEVTWTPDYIAFAVNGKEIGRRTITNGGFWQLGDFGRTGKRNPWSGASKMAPFDEQFYLIINLAVGGVGYFPDSASNPGGKPWRNNSPQAATDFWHGRNQWLSTWNLGYSDDSALQVDYVRVYAL